MFRVLSDNPNNIHKNVQFIEFPAALYPYLLAPSCFVNYQNVGGRKYSVCLVLSLRLASILQAGLTVLRKAH